MSTWCLFLPALILQKMIKCTLIIQVYSVILNYIFDFRHRPLASRQRIKGCGWLDGWMNFRFLNKLKQMSLFSYLSKYFYNVICKFNNYQLNSPGKRLPSHLLSKNWLLDSHCDLGTESTREQSYSLDKAFLQRYIMNKLFFTEHFTNIPTITDFNFRF